MEEELRECDCCGLDKPAEDGDNAYNTRDNYDTWLCRDCLDNGSADEAGYYS